jgi:hypothetical protein
MRRREACWSSPTEGGAPVKLTVRWHMINIHDFANNLRQMDDALSKTIKISNNQVLEIVVSELIEKYQFNIERGDKEWASVFEKVLRYYLNEQEMSHLTPRAADAASLSSAETLGDNSRRG